MRKNRYIPYGYRLEQGLITIIPEEAEIVRQIFEQYAQGEALQSIADAMIKAGIPYSENQPCWNKHVIKRMIENKRYIGESEYPPIMEPELFRRVRDIHESKMFNYKKMTANPADILWKRLVCGVCGKPMLRNGPRTAIMNSECRLRCENKDCGNMMEISLMELHTQIFEQINNMLHHEVGHSGGEGYQPSAEVMRLSNAINRAIENPDDPAKVRNLILQGAIARYDCCPNTDNGLPVGYDWDLFKSRVAHVEIGRDHQIHIRSSS